MTKQTIQKIDEIVSRINLHPEYSSHVKKEFVRSLDADALKQSVAIEKDDDSEPVPTVESALIALNTARSYLGQYGITLSTLYALGKKVEPRNKQTFRQGGVLFGSFAGTRPEGIHSEVENLVKLLEASNVHPVVRAATAHAELVRIHPYQDGNGRSARLLQNFCLEERGYPPAIIRENERDHYLNLMGYVLKNKADSQMSLFALDRLSKNDTYPLFLSFIASKVLSSAEKLEAELQKKRMYSVTFNVRDPSIVYSASQVIRGINRADPEKGVVVNMDAKKKMFIVKGDVSSEQIRSVLDKKDCMKKHYKVSVMER